MHQSSSIITTTIASVSLLLLTIGVWTRNTQSDGCLSTLMESQGLLCTAYSVSCEWYSTFAVLVFTVIFIAALYNYTHRMVRGLRVHRKSSNWIKILFDHKSLVRWYEYSSHLSHHSKVGCFFPSTAHEDIGPILRFLTKVIGRDLRMIQIINARFAWQDLIPLLDHIENLQVVDGTVIDSIPHEFRFEGLLISKDKSRWLVVHGEETFSIKGNILSFTASTAEGVWKGHSQNIAWHVQYVSW